MFLLFQGEREKGKWQNFSKKAFGKKGFVKKSIFKSPEMADGKVGDIITRMLKIQTQGWIASFFTSQVGVGTMGIGGKEMTEFSTVPKYRKGQ